jgi:hypothetical protein
MNSQDPKKDNSVMYLDSENHPISSVCYSMAAATATPAAKLREDEKRIQAVN